jgi:hypothetical protein
VKLPDNRGTGLSEVPRILNVPRESAPVRALPPDIDQAWRWIGWLGLVLAIAGIGDWILAWIPTRFGNVEWEFATIVSTTAGLPLVTMGIAGLAGSAAARGIRWQLRVTGAVALILAVVLLVVLALFMLDVPVALKMVQGPVHLGVLKATTKTIGLGLLFFAVYGYVGIGALRRARKTH